MKISLDAQLLAELRNHATAGDKVATALTGLFAGIKVMSLVAAAKSGNIIAVSGQVTQLDGTPLTAAVDVTATSYPAVGAGTLTMHAAGGTAKAGSGTKALWFQTNADGTFNVDVTDATAADPCLVRFEADNGEAELIALVFT